MKKCFFRCRSNREKSKYFKMNRSTKRFVFFKELFILFLHMSMFPACCFHQRTYVAQEYVTGEPNETGTHSYLNEWVPVSLGSPFTWLCAAYVL